MNIKQGVYFMSNNRVLDMTITFLNSFRVHNKELPLCLIPYDNDFKQIEALKDVYHFRVFDNQLLLETCDSISVKFHGNVVGAYRKLVTWEGAFEQFIYIDIDTVVLDSLSFVWANLTHCKIFTSHSNIAEIRGWVWKDSIYAKNKLNKSQIEYAANTGFIVSTKKTLSINWVLSQVEEALALKEHMTLFCMEQPFLNFLIVTSGYNYGSLFSFFLSDAIREEKSSIKLEFWAGLPRAKINKGRLIHPKHHPVFLVHWAGVWQQNDGDLSKIPYKQLWEYYRNLDPLYLPEPENGTQNSILKRLLAFFNIVK
ncbi:hypothetical protein [Flavobacterium aquicola]|uniref:Lipopolysaccharide biosynthesis glycosyltransferase n=1 Tax=Flavobacterium aquicola TaxID=1682742 RepID=A0A3E0EQQ1_9FLAO|nr:hypothetical protein [Flavobacterium aquicola]REH00094.1 hypothetical protein C8P67_10362 [Flavobacterium aquicola]